MSRSAREKICRIERKERGETTVNGKGRRRGIKGKGEEIRNGRQRRVEVKWRAQEEVGNVETGRKWRTKENETDEVRKRI